MAEDLQSLENEQEHSTVSHTGDSHRASSFKALTLNIAGLYIARGRLYLQIAPFQNSTNEVAKAIKHCQRARANTKNGSQNS
jgi:hypothetical protein